MKGTEYRIKWQKKDITGRYVYRYLGGFSYTGNYFEYEEKWFTEGSTTYPEAVAKWICQQLEQGGVYAEMERV